jgi:hypothetical protein
VNRIAGRATMCMGRARWARLGLDRACSEGARPRRRAIRGYEAGAVPGHGPARFGYT